MLSPDEEFDTRLKSSLEPTQETIDRVKAAALQVERRHRVWRSRYTLGAVLVVLVVAAVGVWRREPAAVQPNVFTAEFSGELLVIHAPNGSVTLLGPPAASRATGFQMMYQGGTK